MLPQMVLFADAMNIVVYLKMHNTKFWKLYFLLVIALTLLK